MVRVFLFQETPHEAGVMAGGSRQHAGMNGSRSKAEA